MSSCCCSVAKWCLTLQPQGLTAAPQAPLSFTVSWSLLTFTSTESVMPSNQLILCHPFSFCLQSFPSSRSFPMSWLFASGGQSIGALASVLPMNIQLLSFRIDWFDFPAVPGIFKSLRQHCILKAPILQCSAFFMVQLSNPHMTTGKITVLTI